jgi:hypothetical protein
MTLAWQRQMRLQVAPPLPTGYRANVQQAISIEALRVVFKVKRTLKKEPSHSKITIYNLAPATRAQFSPGKDARVWLSAGYIGAVGEIFQGDVTYAQASREEPDSLLELELGDGARAYKHARAAESFAPGTTRGDILRRLVAQCGLDPGNAPDYYNALTGQAVNGYSVDGQVQRSLTEVLAAEHLTWSVQGGAIQILPAVGYVAKPAILLTPLTGLIGSPKWGSPEKKGGKRTLKFQSLLQAQLVPGGRVQLEAEDAKGVFVLQKVEHTGDTQGGKDWVSDCEAVPV